MWKSEDKGLLQTLLFNEKQAKSVTKVSWSFCTHTCSLQSRWGQVCSKLQLFVVSVPTTPGLPSLQNLMVQVDIEFHFITPSLSLSSSTSFCVILFVFISLSRERLPYSQQQHHQSCICTKRQRLGSIYCWKCCASHHYCLHMVYS